MNVLDYIKDVPALRKIILLLGIDKAIFYTIITLIWGALAGPISIYFIINYLTINEQGFWFTFQSLGALTVFAELGFTTIITQFISHEYAHLNEKNGKLIGDTEIVNRIISLIRFSFKFYIFITFAALILLTVIGIIFLMHSTLNFFILMSWVLYSFTGAFLLLVSMFAAILKGFNKVDTAQKIIFLASLISNISVWIALFAGFGLWALSIGGFVNILLSLIMFLSSSKTLWLQLLRSKVSDHYNWFKETLPLQWRYAISWSSGYLIFQFIVPVTMYYAGAELAGMLGLSLVLARAVQGIASSWGATKIPQFNIHVAKKERLELDNLLKKVQHQSLFVFSISAVLLILVLIYIFPILGWSNRVLSIPEIMIILIAEGVNLAIFNWAFYLRSHKEEPYMRISVISALITAIGVWLSMYFFDSTFFALCSYCAAQIIILIPAWRILVNKRKEYESNIIE